MQGRALRARPAMVRLTRYGRVCFPSGWNLRLRGASGQEGGNRRFPPSCQSPTFPSGRAARAEVSDAFRLPPGGCCNRHVIGCRPGGRSRAGTGRIVRSIKKALWNLHSVFLLFIRKHLNIKCFTDLEKQIKGGCFPPALDLINISLCPVDHFPQLRLRQPLFLAPPAEQCTIINHFTLLQPSP